MHPIIVNKRSQNDIEKYEKADNYRKLSELRWPRGTVEHYWKHFLSLVTRYAWHLDVLLLKRGINLMYYQQEYGVFLFEKRNSIDVGLLLGSFDLAQELIEKALPKVPNNVQSSNVKKYIDEVFTEEAKKYYAKAIDVGYIKEVGDKYEWAYIPKGQKCHKISLGLFLKNIYTKKNIGRIPFKALENLFDETRLDRDVDRAIATDSPRQKWRKGIDEFFQQFKAPI